MSPAARAAGAVTSGVGEGGGWVFCERLSSGTEFTLWLLFIIAVTNTKLCAWEEEDSGGHVL